MAVLGNGPGRVLRARDEDRTRPACLTGRRWSGAGWPSHNRSTLPLGRWRIRGTARMDDAEGPMAKTSRPPPGWRPVDAFDQPGVPAGLAVGRRWSERRKQV